MSRDELDVKLSLITHSVVAFFLLL